MTEDSKEKKAAKKVALKAEAEKLGVPYEELKAQRKGAKNDKKKRKREVDELTSDADAIEAGEDHVEEVKRMRSWSKDLGADGQMDGKRRTRSMDLAQQKKNEPPPPVVKEPAPEPKNTLEWRKLHSITIRGHGKHAHETSFPEPYLKFKDTPFSPEITKTLEKAGFAAPTPVQSQAWPIAVSGSDIISVAKTGSGKTLGFLMPALHGHLKSGVKVFHGSTSGFRRAPMPAGTIKGPILLVLAPTRELACQIQEETRKFGRSLGCREVCCFGGASKYPQIQALEQGVEFCIATPGRLNDLIEMGKADLSNVKYLVLDEADRMLDMGFEPQIRTIIILSLMIARPCSSRQRGPRKFRGLHTTS